MHSGLCMRSTKNVVTRPISLQPRSGLGMRNSIKPTAAMVLLTQKETKMAKKARSESEVCGNLERGPGERSSGGNNTTTGPYAGPGGTIDVGYSPYDIELVNLGEANPKMMRNSNKRRG